MAKARSVAEKEALKERQDAVLAELLEQLGDKLTSEAPEGFVKETGDVAGFWVQVSPIQGIIRGAKLSDSQLDPEKSSALVLIQLTAPCIIDTEGEFSVAKEGQVVGVWYKPGMRQIRSLMSQEVWIRKTAETKDTGKGNPMIVYEVRSKNVERRAAVHILDDYREDSKPFEDGDGKVQGLHDLETGRQTALAKIPI